MSQSNLPPQLTPVAGPKRRGCLFYSLIAVAIIALLVIAGGYFGFRFAIRKTIEQYTALAAVSLPVAELTPAEDAALRDRLATFYSAFENGDAATLELTVPQLNVLINENTDLKGRVHFSVEGSKLRGRISLPLDPTGVESLRGRWLNGDAVLNFAVVEGKIRLTISEFTANGRQLPDVVMRELARQNLMENTLDDPRTSDYVSRVAGVGLDGDRLVVKFRGR